MKLATLPDVTADGRLVVVSRDLSRAVAAPTPFLTLQAAIDHWSSAEPVLAALAADLESGRAHGALPFDPTTAAAPFPRAPQWLDGSAFLSHSRLMTKAFSMPSDPAAGGIPLMYQGLSDHFYGPTEDTPFLSEEDGIDFEAEYAVVTDAVPMGVSVENAARHIKLILLLNDWSLRSLAPREMRTGFGFVQAKPACSMAPVAITPDELGEAWRDARVALPLKVTWNGALFGHPDGGGMTYGFDELIAHAARTRRLSAGTIIGSGTVSNDDAEAVGSACISERRALEMIAGGGAPSTGFMKFGDRVRLEVFDAAGASLFGAIDQQVVPANR